jgi:hypothetical protein
MKPRQWKMFQSFTNQENNKWIGEVREIIPKLEKIKHVLCMQIAKWLQLGVGVDNWIMDYRKNGILVFTESSYLKQGC